MYLNHFASTKLSQCEATLTSSNWYPVQIVKVHLRFVFHRIWLCSKTIAEVRSTKSKNTTDHSGLVSARAEAATYCVGQVRPITNSWDSSSPLVLPAAGHISPHSAWEQHLRTRSEVNNTSLLWDSTSNCCYETRLPLDISLGHLHNQTYTLSKMWTVSITLSFHLH